MRLTALPPPPPQPTTLMRARPSCNSLSLIGMTWSSLVRCLDMASSSWLRCCSLEKIAQPPHCFLVRRSEPDRLPAVRVAARVSVRAPLDQTCGDGERRALAPVRETDHAHRLAEPHRCVENALRRVRGAHEARA